MPPRRRARPAGGDGGKAAAVSRSRGLVAPNAVTVNTLRSGSRPEDDGLAYESVRGFKMPVHAAARWYSWISPPSRSRRLTSLLLALRVRGVGNARLRPPRHTARRIEYVDVADRRDGRTRRTEAARGRSRFGDRP